MAGYTVKELSALAGVSVRTLHHYDQVGLLKPELRSESKYRYYGKKELLRLQQILFYKELGFALHEIKELLDQEDFDLLGSLEYHRSQLRAKAEQMKKLLSTIDKTIEDLKNNQNMMTDKELYDGFSVEQAEAYRKEASERWGDDTVKQSEMRIKNLGPMGWEELKWKGDAITREMVTLMGKEANSPEVQEVVAKYYDFLSNFYDVTEEIFRGLGRMYVEDERFTATYDKYAIGLAAFMNEAMQAFCDLGSISSK